MEDTLIDTTIKPHTNDKTKSKLTIILEQALLELSPSKHTPEIMNSDDHLKHLKSQKKTPTDYTPELVHQSLLSLFDSPLNKAGLLQVYIHTKNKQLIEINPKCRIPRTYKRFIGLFSQLLLKGKITAADSNETLIQIVNKPIKQLMRGVPIITLSEKGRIIDIDTYVEGFSNKQVCFVIGAMNVGDVTSFVDYNDDVVAISSYDLSSLVVCAKVCTAFEGVWDIR